MSASPFGGRHSPGARDATGASRGMDGASRRPLPGMPGTGSRRGQKFRGRRAARVDVRTLFLYVLPTPLLFAALGAIGGGAPLTAASDLLAYALLIGGTWLLREGQRAEAAYEARAVARRPAIPRKIMAAMAATLGVGLASVAGWGLGPIAAAGMAALAGLSHLMAFGIDPLKNKGIDLGEGEAGRVAEALDRAEAELAEIVRLVHTIRDREIEDRVERLMASVRGLLKQLEADPRELPRARRYLTVYLRGAHEATRKYAENHETLADPTLRSDYLALLGELEGSFTRGRQMLLADNRTELEVEIEVLRERLGHEVR